ncbi:hypothetical protein HPB47_006236 [Ixodes persulcatus]|uniref:Uncharacterized protein n=1 Tax=Ixodes persulcatus TaxID=34615 RepID=A0AC60PAW8_IXOPE|nr:hypothetical protein HPB47_006236 [Ixodes persulcatus]
MPTGCSVLLCPNRTPQSPLVRAKKLLFHRLPREEPLRELRVCSEHFDGDRDYRRLPSVLRDAGQAMKKVHLKPDTVPSLRLPPHCGAPLPCQGPSRANHTSRAQLPLSSPTGDTRHSGSGRPARKSGIRTDSEAAWHKGQFCTQANSYAKGLTTHWVQTEDLETPDSSSTTAGSNSTTTAAAFASTTATSAVPPQRPGPACAMSPVLSDSDEEEEEEEDDDCDDDPLWEPPTKGGFVESATTVSGEPDCKERKFLVFESSLRQLLAVCQTCYSPCSVSLSTICTILTVHTSCPAGHKNRWDSQPYINGRPLGNLLITSFVPFTGASPTITLRLLRLMNIVAWEEEQEKLLEELRDQPLDLAGDGRCDSPGYSAKYLMCSLHAPHVNKIVHFEQVQVGESGQSRHADHCCRPSFRAHSRSTCPGLRIAFPTPALRRLAVSGYRCPSLAVEPPRDRRGLDQLARARRFHRSCSRPRWWTAPGFAMGQARQAGPDVPASFSLA